MAANTDLLTGLSEEVVLGEVVPRLCKLPWNERPLLRTLNQSWNNALEKRFPIYHQRIHNPPNILSNALILSHIKKSPARGEQGSYRLLGLWVCKPGNNNANISQSAITVRLPKHPQIEVQKYTKFVCDIHRVFSLTPSVVTEEPNAPHDIYNVWMLDLRDFNLHWKRLPGLPKLGNCVYASSSLNGDYSSYIWQRGHSDSLEAEGWKLRRGENDMNSLNSEWHWDYFNVNTRPPRSLNFDIMSERLPLYVEIELRVEQEVAKTLFRKCPIPEYILNRSDYRSYVFMLLDDKNNGTSECNLCYITVEGSKVCILMVGLDGERTRILEEQEWNDFVEYWNNRMRVRGAFERPDKWQVHSRERSAIRFFLEGNRGSTRQELELTESALDEVINKHSIIKVAQKGPIYGYSYLGSRSEILP